MIKLDASNFKIKNAIRTDIEAAASETEVNNIYNDIFTGWVDCPYSG